MNFRNQLGRVLCGAGLALTFAIAPGTWAISHGSSAAQSSAMSMQSQMSKLDINTASESQLKMLPGVGDVYAKKIVAGRPYQTKNQLVTKGVLPQNVYDKIQSKIIASRPKK